MDAKVSSQRKIYVVDQNNNRIHAIDGFTGIVTTFAGGGSQVTCLLPIPATLSRQAIQSAQLVGTGAQCASSTNPCRDNGPARRAQLNLTRDYSRSTAIDVAGYLYISDTRDNRIRLAGPTIPPFPATQVQQSGRCRILTWTSIRRSKLLR